jgi:chromosome segregation ATPase
MKEGFLERLKTAASEMNELQATNENLVKEVRQKSEELESLTQLFRETEDKGKELKLQVSTAQTENQEKENQLRNLERDMKNMEDKFSEISTKYEDARILFEAQKVAV